MPPAKGYKQSDEHKRKRAAAWVGRKHTPESRAKMSAAARRRTDRPRAEAHPSWIGDEAGYTAAHLRIRQERGPASDHRCLDCGGRARHWALAHERTTHTLTAGGRTYSPDPADYDPRCVACHARYDRCPRR